MYATEIVMPSEIFNFSGQSKIDTFSLDQLVHELVGYDEMMVNRIRLCLEAIRVHADTFPYWQRRKRTGRPPIRERTFLIAFLLRQLFDATFRDTEGLLRLLDDYFDIDHIPDHTSLVMKNRSRRWMTVWRRFHKYIMSLLPRRKAVIATDSTGLSGRN